MKISYLYDIEIAEVNKKYQSYQQYFPCAAIALRNRDDYLK